MEFWTVFFATLLAVWVVFGIMAVSSVTHFLIKEEEDAGLRGFRKYLYWAILIFLCFIGGPVMLALALSDK